MMLGAFLVSLMVFLGIGVWSSTASQGTTEDYLVAGRSIPPWLTALSSVATNNSGFMFIGMIGFTYREGFSALWMAAAWVMGDALAWWWVHPRVRRYAERVDAVSVPRLLGTHPDGTSSRSVTALAAALTFLFLGGYAAAQLQAGGTALHELFGWPLEVGSILGALIVVVYCFSGGLRASIWTDAAQSIVMFGAMAALVLYAFIDVGGPLALRNTLAAQDPELIAVFPPDIGAAFPMYLLGFIAGGFGAIGQPHILIRTMALDRVENIPSARRTYFAWFIPFYLMGVGVALYARAILPELADPDPALGAAAAQAAAVQATEGALPALSMALLPDVLVGLMLAGLFAATMSTADSQVLACSAAATEDLFPGVRERPWAPKVATLSVAALALGIALSPNDGVFALVLASWSVLGAALGPLLLVRLGGSHPNTPLALTMMATGLATTYAWPWPDTVFRLLPGLVLPLLVFALIRLLQPDTVSVERGIGIPVTRGEA